MGTNLGIDSRLNNISDLSESIIEELIQILKDNYNSENLTLGKNMTDNYSQKKVFYALTDSEFENKFLTIINKNTVKGFPFEIIFESRYADSPIELKAQFDETSISKLPEQMIEDLRNKLNEFNLE
tara:strand:+ start:413 stop:790 length:378 start_codon:yes stop_codon:yes gene_type:complete